MNQKRKAFFMAVIVILDCLLKITQAQTSLTDGTLQNPINPNQTLIRKPDRLIIRYPEGHNVSVYNSTETIWVNRNTSLKVLEEHIFEYVAELNVNTPSPQVVLITISRKYPHIRIENSKLEVLRKLRKTINEEDVMTDLDYYLYYDY